MFSPICLNAGDLIEENYRIIRELRRESLEITYLAEDTSKVDNALVLIKQIQIPQKIENLQFFLEKETIVDVVEEEDYFYIVEDYVVGGHYRIIRELGRGGFGRTYLAEDTYQIDGALPVVIKQIKISQLNDSLEKRPNDYLNKIKKEAKILANLNHEQIPKFLGRFEEEGYFYIVQEYIQGNDLKKELIPGTKIPQQQVIKMLLDILTVLQFVHERGIIHRDLKPANLIRREKDNKIILIDFGSVKELTTKYTNSSGTIFTKAIGTPGYIPAEQFSGHPKFNSDIYALGIIVLQALTGLTVEEVVNLKRDNECNLEWENFVIDVDERLRKIVSKMLCYHFSPRYQSVLEIWTDLHEETGLVCAPPVSSKKLFLNKLFKLIKNSPLQSQAIAAISLVLMSFTINQQWTNFISIFNPACSQEIKDNISCGEEVLDPHSQGSIRKTATELLASGNYQAAFEYFQDSWQYERREAETLIYMNNALLEALKVDYYTIAVAVPLTSSQGSNLNNSYLGQDFLRGIAQAQTEVNLNLIKANKKIKETLPGQNFLNLENIDRPQKKGIKIVVIDDGNNANQAQKIAQSIIDKPKILGVVGHAASEMTLSTVDIYKQKQLALVSPGTNTKEITLHVRPNFFRVVYNNLQEAEVLVDYLEKVNLQDKKLALFYNPGSEYSNYLSIEIREQLKQKNLKLVKGFNLADPKFSSEIALKETQKLGANILVLLPDGQVTNSLAQAKKVIASDNGSSIIVGGNTLANQSIEKIDSRQSLLKLVATSPWHPLVSYNQKFSENTQQLWGESINGRTALGYDATLALIKAIKLQNYPTRKGTLKQLKSPEFMFMGATGKVKFNTPTNGDRVNFFPTLVHLIHCQKQNRFYTFVPIEYPNAEAAGLDCN
jgi:serine/threonine protein kinase